MHRRALGGRSSRFAFPARPLRDMEQKERPSQALTTRLSKSTSYPSHSRPAQPIAPMENIKEMQVSRRRMFTLVLRFLSLAGERVLCSLFFCSVLGGRNEDLIYFAPDRPRKSSNANRGSLSLFTGISIDNCFKKFSHLNSARRVNILFMLVLLSVLTIAIGVLNLNKFSL